MKAVTPCLRRIIALLVLAFLALGALGATVVSIPDPALDLYVRMDLNISDERLLTADDLLGLTNLDLGFPDLLPAVTNLEGLQYATNLQVFETPAHQFDSIAPLSNLYQLRAVLIPLTPVRDAAPLRGLTNLTWLSLGDTGITNLENISSLFAISNLSIGGLSNTMLQHALALTNVETLGINGMAVSNLSPLLAFPKLRVLNAFKSSVVDMTALTNLPHLISADLTGNYLDLTAGTAASKAVLFLRDRGVTVYTAWEYKPVQIQLALKHTSNVPALEIRCSPADCLFYVYWTSNLNDYFFFTTSDHSTSVTIPTNLQSSPRLFFRAEQIPVPY